MEPQSLQWLLAAVMVTITCRIGWVDARELRIPNGLSFALAFFGVLYQLVSDATTLLVTILGACATVLILYAIRLLHIRLRGRVGLGLGDVKLAGACALWLGPWNLPLYFLIASGSALAFAAGLMLLTHFNVRTTKIPFGPFLGFSLVLVWTMNAVLFIPIGD